MRLAIAVTLALVALFTLWAGLSIRANARGERGERRQHGRDLFV